MEAWSRYLAFYKPAWKIIVLTSLASTLQASFGIPIAWLLRRLFDASALTGVELAMTLGGIVLIYLAGDALLIFSQRRNLALVKPVARRMRMQMMERAMLRPRAFERSNSVGAMHSALVQDVELVDHMSSAVLSRLLPALFSVCVLFAVLAWLSLPLFLITLVVLTFGWLATTFYRRRVRARVVAFDGVRNAYNAGAIGMLQRLELARTYGAEKSELARHADLSGRLAAQGMAMASGNNALFVLHNQIAVFTAIAVLFTGHRLVESGSITIGALLAFYVVLAMSRGHLTSFATLMPGLLSGNAALQRLQPLLAAGQDSGYTGSRSIDFNGAVELAGVSYAYRGEPVLRDVSMATAPGRVAGLSGPNGAGKTTIARLILGLDRPSDGVLRAGGYSYDELSIDALRRRIAFVAQDPVIFASSVRENLLFGLEEAPGDDAVARALEIAGADFVQELESGLDAWLGDDGVRLSGGQRQRLSIARAILRKPALMILDEPTNHLGGVEACAIIERIRRDNPEIALLLVTHDPEMLAMADHSWRVTGGSLIESAA